MATEAELRALASACEKAAGPARSMDGAITKALGEYPCWATVQSERQPELFTDGKTGLRAREWLCPRYTASIDAAMTLVPEGLWAEGSLSSPGQLEVHGPCTFDPIGKGWAATPALALTAACLRARAATMAKEQSDG